MHDTNPPTNRIVSGDFQGENAASATPLNGDAAVTGWLSPEDALTAKNSPDGDEFSAWFGNARDWVCTQDSQGNYLAMNPSGLRMLGYSAADVRMLPMERLVAPELHEFARRMLQKTLADGSVAPYELEFRTRLGQPVHVEISAWIVTRAGKPVVQSIARDISSRKQAQIEAECQQALLRSLLESSPDNIYFKDRQSRFIECSTALCAKFGVDRDALIGTTDFDHFDAAHAQAAYDDEQEIIRTGKPIVGKVEKEGQKNGEQFWALTAKMPFHNKAGEIIGTFGISKDITLMKRAEAELEGVHKQLMGASHQAGRAEVATSVLHNVGNVLNSVNVSSALVSQKLRNSKLASLTKIALLLQEQAANLGSFVVEDPRGRQLPEYLTSLATRLTNEQNDVLAELQDMTKNVEHIKEIVAMQQSYARVSGVAESIAVVDMVEDAIRMNIGAMQRHSVTLVREFTEQPTIIVEKHKVLQILVNLIRNAKYALDDGPKKEKLMTLRVALTTEGKVSISVSDNGVGIPAENLTRIFGHGFTTRRDGHGFGLHSGALAAKEMGGVLTAHSDGPGKGATFTLELPFQSPENTEA